MAEAPGPARCSPPGIVETVMECSFQDCEDPAKARGLCMKHYMRWYRHGDPKIVIRERRPHVVEHGTVNEYSNYNCRCDDCKRAWRDWYRESARRRRLFLGPCTIPGCEIGQYSKGLCKPHYERERDGRAMNTLIIRRPKAWVAADDREEEP